MEPHLLRAIRDHAYECYPNESCGLIVQTHGVVSYVPCANLSQGQGDFSLDPKAIAQAEANGRIVAVVHSHPDAAPVPSQADLAQIEAWGMPWHIVSWPSEEIQSYRPTGYHPALLGRVFVHGRLDCFSLIRDYYLEELGIRLPNFERQDDWWTKGENLYLDNYAKAGFVAVTGDPKPHDVILMTLKAPVPNHAGIFLGNDTLLHHLPARLSRRDRYAGLWAQHTHLILRHESLC